MASEKLINYQQLSLILTGRKENIRKGKVPKRHREAVRELDSILDYWVKKHKSKEEL